jgi:hypothetical protein
MNEQALRFHWSHFDELDSRTLCALLQPAGEGVHARC